MHAAPGRDLPDGVEAQRREPACEAGRYDDCADLFVQTEEQQPDTIADEQLEVVDAQLVAAAAALAPAGDQPARRRRWLPMTGQPAAAVPRVGFRVQRS